MTPAAWILLAILVVLIVLGIGAFLYLKDRRTKELRARFGPEYSRTIKETGDRDQAEARLRERQKRVERFKIRALSREDKTRFLASWQGVQAEFVDNPKEAVTHADALLGEVMTARNYPASDFEQRCADLSVDYPMVVQDYRAAHEIAVRHERGEAGTEQLRQAMIHYRALFDELVAEPESAPAQTAHKRATEQAGISSH
jgi:hypothetical protein